VCLPDLVLLAHFHCWVGHDPCNVISLLCFRVSSSAFSDAGLLLQNFGSSILFSFSSAALAQMLISMLRFSLTKFLTTVLSRFRNEVFRNIVLGGRDGLCACSRFWLCLFFSLAVLTLRVVALGCSALSPLSTTCCHTWACF